MRHYFALLFLILASVFGRAATIVGPVYLSYSNRPYSGPILLRPLSTPLPYTPNLITGGDFTVRTDTNGLFSVELQPGNYRVQVGADRPFVIDVPTNAATYTMLERITNALSWNSSIRPSTNSYATANSTTEGVVRTYSTQASPVVWTTNDVAALGAYLGQLVYPTVVDMIASTAPINSGVLVTCLGRDTAGDGGGGDFKWDSLSTATTNTITTFQASAGGTGRYLRNVPDTFEINAAWAGAYPDDGVNDSTAIQAALDYCYSKKHGTVIFNSGVYNLASTLYVPYRVNLSGKTGWKLTELLAATSTSNQYMLGGSTQFRMMDSANLFAMIVFNSTDGYVRQASETIEDGTTADSIFQESLVENIVLNGNPFNNTAATHGIVGFHKWNITVRNCGFINLRGSPMYWRDCNQLMVENVWMKGSIGNVPNRGMWVYSCADSQFRGGYAFGFSGPAIWVNGSTSAVNLFSDWLIGNSVVTNTVFNVSSVSSGQWTLSGSPDFLTGDHIELRTTGTVPTGFSRVGLYYLYKISSGVYGLHTNYNSATNGSYLTTVDSGSGTHSFTKGPASAIFISGGANCNSFVNIRADQCSGPGFTFRDAYANVFTGGLISQCDGAANLETIPDSEKVGYRFDTYAQNNGVVNATIRSQPIAFQSRDNAYGNLMLANYQYVTTRFDNLGDSANYEPVLASGSQATIGSSTNQVALNLIGNASGVRLLKMVRSDITQTNGLGVQAGGFTFWDETGGRAVGSFVSDSSSITLKLGSSSSSARTGIIVGENTTGTDTASPSMQFWAGTGTGSSTVGGDFTFFTPNATTSGTSSQGVSSKFRIRRNGQINLWNTAADPTINLGAGDIWFRSDLNKFRVRLNAASDNLATESYVTAAISGSGALTDGDKGDITVSSTGTVFTIDNSAVTYAKMQNVSATSKLLGRNSSTTGPPEEITLGSGLSMSGTTLSVTGGGTGDVVGPGSSTDNAIVRFDGTTGKLVQNSAATVADTSGDITAGKYNGVTISGSSTPTLAVTGTTTVSGANTGDQTITLTGDVTGSGTGSFAATIANSAVSNAKMANMSASTIKARITGSTGAPEDATFTQLLDLVGSAAQGDILYRGASTWTRLGAGTSGQFLKTQGTGANPLWASVPGGGDALTSNPLSQFASTTSSQLAGVLSNESGTGLAVFNDGATLTNTTLNGLSFTGTAGSTLSIGTGGTLGTAAYTASSAYQATDAEITALAGLTSAANKVPYFTGSGAAATADFTSTGRTVVSQSSEKGVFDAINGAEATVASATTTDIGAASSDKVSITGTTTITGFGTATAGIKRSGRFTGALTLTHNATSLILPGGANITTVAGDRFEAVSLGSGNWVVYNYVKATWTGSGSAVFATSPTLTTPTIGVATATSINKVAITAPTTSATLTIADGKTATVNNSITFAGTDSTTMTFPSVSASIGYLGIPQGSKSADYTLVLADAGTHIFHPSSDANSRTFTIPANGSVAFPVGTAVTFYNASANSCTIAITTDTLRKAGTGTTGSVTLPQYAMATALKVTTTEWVISGNGI